MLDPTSMTPTRIAHIVLDTPVGIGQRVPALAARRTRSCARRCMFTWWLWARSPLPGRAPAPRAVGAEIPARDVVGEGAVEHGDQLLALPRALDRDHHLDAAVEVPLHQVGAPEVELVELAGLEREHPAVLEEAADDRPHLDVLAQALDARAKHAHRAGADLDPAPCCAAPYSSSTIASSVSALTLKRIRARLPAAAALPTRGYARRAWRAA